MAFRSSTGLTPGSGNSVVINVPAGAAVNDIAVVGIYKENDRVITPPAGFTEKVALITSATARGSLYVLWKRLTAADTGTYTFSWGAGGVWRSAGCSLFSGRTTTGDPFDGTVGTAESTVAVTTLDVSTSPTAADGDAVDFHTNFQGGNSYTPPTNYTERQDLDVIGMFTRDAVASGTTGNVTATSNVSGFAKAFLGVLAAAAAGATDVTPADAGHAHAVDQPALTQVHVLTSNDAAHGHAADQPTLTGTHEISVNSATHGHAADQPALTQANQITVNDAAHAHTAGQPALTQVHILAPADATHAHSVDQPALTQVHALTPADALHGHTADQATVSPAGATDVTPNDAAHGHTADQPALTQVHVLTSNDAAHAHSADQPALTGTHELAPADASHAHTADQPTLTGGVVVTPADSLHGHTVDQPALTQVHVLAPASALHAHSADAPALTQLHVLVPAGALHAHTADQPETGPANLPNLFGEGHRDAIGSVAGPTVGGALGLIVR